MVKFFEIIKSKNKKIKDGIDIDVGKSIEKVFFYIVIITLFLFIPIIFTLLSTLMGGNYITSSLYYGIFYTTWVIFFISLFVWLYFKEFKYKKKEEENNS